MKDRIDLNLINLYFPKSEQQADLIDDVGKDLEICGTTKIKRTQENICEEMKILAKRL